MLIAVDFDGTIVEHRYPAIGKEIPFATEMLAKLIADGHKLILWTSREGDLLDAAIEFCRQRGVTFYAVNSENPASNFDRGEVARKAVADMYIDDRNLGGLPRWPLIYEMISKNLTFGDMIASGEYADEVDTDASSSTHHHHHHKKKHRKGWFTRLRERTREARAKYNHTGSSSSGTHHRRHW